ncbi:hypothetical protein [Staphylococcus hominis]|uniref:hypothetical protein n=1 Tax=Staphylococcus hominis TaxID=1290 RepID=UPI0021BDDA29|nr:hypothetical protein [Staphylococcus hominis]
MKKLLGTLFAATLVLSACSQDDTKEDENKKAESKTEKKADGKKDNKSKEEKKSQENKDSKSTQEDNSTEEQDTQETATNENQQNTQSIDITNIKDKGALESVIYGNYSETEKIQAYNSAVSNGVIPQGNVMEGPASAAYESSLRVESGQEKSVYENIPRSSGGTDAGMIDYDEVDRQLEEDKKAQDEKEAALQKEYFDLSDKMFEDDVSDEEYEAMEKRQNEILDEVEPIN